MKKLLITFFMMIVLTFSFGLFACVDETNKQEHTHTFDSAWSVDDTYHWHEANCEHKEEKSELLQHTFDKEVAEEKYLNTEATCTAKATYFKSCVCGEKGTEIFESGETLGHTFDKEVAEEKYLNTEATCTAKATYFKSCFCGAKGTETFESGEPLKHDFTSENAKIEWIWASDYSVAYALLTCGRDESHTEKVVATIDVTTKQAWCNATGKNIYIATVEIDGNTFTDEKAKSIPIDANAHHNSTKRRDVVQETYDNEGYTGDIYCTRCKKTVEKGSVIPKTGTLSESQIDALLNKAYSTRKLSSSYIFQNVTTKVQYDADNNRYDVFEQGAENVDIFKYLQNVNGEYRYGKVECINNIPPAFGQYVVIDEDEYLTYVNKFTNQNSSMLFDLIYKSAEISKNEVEYYFGSDKFFFNKNAQKREDGRTYLTFEISTIINQQTFKYVHSILGYSTDAYNFADSLDKIRFNLVIDEENKVIYSATYELNGLNENEDFITYHTIDDELATLPIIDYNQEIDCSITEIELVDDNNIIDKESFIYDMFIETALDDINEKGFIAKFIKSFYPIDKTLYDLEFYIIADDFEQQIYVGDPLSVPDYYFMDNVKLKVKVVEKGSQVDFKNYTLVIDGEEVEFIDETIGTATFGELKVRLNSLVDVKERSRHFVGWSYTENGELIRDEEIITSGSTLYAIIKDAETSLTIYGLNNYCAKFAIKDNDYEQYIIEDEGNLYFIGEYHLAGCDFIGYYLDKNLVDKVETKELNIAGIDTTGYLLERGANNTFYVKAKTYVVLLKDMNLNAVNGKLIDWGYLHDLRTLIQTLGFEGFYNLYIEYCGSIIYNTEDWRDFEQIDGLYLDKEYTNLFDETDVSTNKDIMLYVKTSSPIVTFASVEHATAKTNKYYLTHVKNIINDYFDEFKALSANNIVFYNVDDGYDVVGLYLDKECTIPLETWPTESVTIYPKVTEYNKQESIFTYKDYAKNSIYRVVTGLKEDVTATELTIPKYADDGGLIIEIDARAFKDNIDITKVILPDTITEIGSYAFAGCENLQEFIMTDSVIIIQTGAFNSCVKLKNISLSENLVNIGFEAFAYSGLESIELPDKLNKVSELAFGYCRSLKSITFGNGIKLIDEDAFFDCQSLEVLNIPASVERIAYSAFARCEKLHTINFEEGIKTINEATFYGCKSLTTVTLPSSLKRIDEGAFAECIALEEVIFSNTTGWYVTETEGALDGEAVDFTDCANNAKILKKQRFHIFYRGE